MGKLSSSEYPIPCHLHSPHPPRLDHVYASQRVRVQEVLWLNDKPLIEGSGRVEAEANVKSSWIDIISRCMTISLGVLMAVIRRRMDLGEGLSLPPNPLKHFSAETGDSRRRRKGSLLRTKCMTAAVCCTMDTTRGEDKDCLALVELQDPARCVWGSFCLGIPTAESAAGRRSIPVRVLPAVPHTRVHYLKLVILYCLTFWKLIYRRSDLLHPHFRAYLGINTYIRTGFELRDQPSGSRVGSACF